MEATIARAVIVVIPKAVTAMKASGGKPSSVLAVSGDGVGEAEGEGVGGVGVGFKVDVGVGARVGVGVGVNMAASVGPGVV